MTVPRTIRITYTDLDELAAHPHPDNPKTHDLAALQASFDRFGFGTPVVRNAADGLLLEGHGRVEALLARRGDGLAPPDGIHERAGRWLVPTVAGLALDPEHARQYLVAANRLTERGGWDEARLVDLLTQWAEDVEILAAVGFEQSDIDVLLDGLHDDTLALGDPDAVPERRRPSAVRVAPGELWRLGRHRLLCGDATDPASYDRVLGGHLADLVFTDPPYGVDYGAHGGAGGRGHRPIANDALAPEAFDAFLRAWTVPLVAHAGGAIYCCMSSRAWPAVQAAFAQAGAHWSDTIIWMKDRFVLGRADYQRQYEPIWYGWREDGPHRWCGARDQSDVWEIPRPSRSDLHPTMKPVALVERAIDHASRRGDLVLDPFAGSGTTLIAAERRGRRAALVEIDPTYAQVIVDRWDALGLEPAERLE